MIRLKKFPATICCAVVFLLFSGFLKAQVANPVTWKYETEKVDETHYNLIMNATIEDKWHLYSQYFDFGGPMPLYIQFEEAETYRTIDSVSEYTAPIKEYDETFEIDVCYFCKEAKFVQPIEVLSKDGFTIKGTISGQACFDDGACIMISDDLSFDINGGSATVENNSSSLSKTPVIVTENTYEDETDDSKSLWSFFFLSFIFGILGILTPCVFPMIPMTISFFMQGSSSKFNSVIKALIFGISIMLLYTIVGVIISLTNAGANLTTVLSTHWIPNLIFFVLFVLFAASLFGVFEIVLPNSLANKADRQVDKGGLLASFFLAVTTVIVSFSCTGPIVGALLVKAASGSVLEPTIGMLGFGLGFALPFTILAIAPNWLKKLPKSGGWLNAIKVIMGFCLLAFSMKYFSNIDQNYHLGILSRDLYIAIWIVLSILAGFYMLGKIRFKLDSKVESIGFFRMLIASIFFVFALYLTPGMFGANLSAISGMLPPKTTQQFDLTAKAENASSEAKLCEKPKYSESMHLAYGVNGYFDYKQALDCAKSQNKPVILYFTGHSCSNCKKMQASIWENQTVVNHFNNDFVLAALYVDERSVLLPEEDWFVSSNDNKEKKTLGDVNSDIQVVNFKKNTQPYYVIISPDGKVLNAPMSYNTDPEEFIEFLEKGLENFENE